MSLSSLSWPSFPVLLSLFAIVNLGLGHSSVVHHLSSVVQCPVGNESQFLQTFCWWGFVANVSVSPVFTSVHHVPGACRGQKTSDPLRLVVSSCVGAGN